MKIEKTLNCIISLWHEMCYVEIEHIFNQKNVFNVKKSRKRVWTETTRIAKIEPWEVHLLGESVVKEERDKQQSEIGSKRPGKLPNLPNTNSKGLAPYYRGLQKKE